MNEFLQAAKKADNSVTQGQLLKALIGPHAGLDYSGPTAAWAYINIDPSKYKRIMLLGPSHYIYLEGCSLSQMTQYLTPVGNLKVDTETTAELAATGKFGTMTKKEDE